MLVSLSMRLSKIHAIVKAVQHMWDHDHDCFRTAELAKIATDYYHKPLTAHQVAYHMAELSKYFYVKKERDSLNRRWYVFER